MDVSLRYVYQKCILLHKCEHRYPYLNNNIEGWAQRIGMSSNYLFYPTDPKDLPSGCSKEDFCGYVIEGECLEFIDDNNS